METNVCQIYFSASILVNCWENYGKEDGLFGKGKNAIPAVFCIKLKKNLEFLRVHFCADSGRRCI